MTEPDSLTEHNAVIEEALDALADAALDWHDDGTSLRPLHDAAWAYGQAVMARSRWRAKVRLKPKAGGWPT